MAELCRHKPIRGLGMARATHRRRAGFARPWRNTGKIALQIEQLSTSCNCTKASVDQATIAPGGSTVLRVTMDPQEDNLYGNLFRVITIRSNDPATPQAKVDFRVTIPKPGE